VLLPGQVVIAILSRSLSTIRVSLPVTNSNQGVPTRQRLAIIEGSAQSSLGEDIEKSISKVKVPYLRGNLTKLPSPLVGFELNQQVKHTDTVTAFVFPPACPSWSQPHSFSPPSPRWPPHRPPLAPSPRSSDARTKTRVPVPAAPLEELAALRSRRIRASSAARASGGSSSPWSVAGAKGLRGSIGRHSTRIATDMGMCFELATIAPPKRIPSRA
jgi:hypothetical protein